MSNSRASIFEKTADLDISDFTPKPARDAHAPAAPEVRVVAEAANFRSREALALKPAPTSRRPARRYRTGRNVQFNVKALQETVDQFYAITEQQQWVLGYTLERAVAALARELESPQ